MSRAQRLGLVALTAAVAAGAFAIVQPTGGGDEKGTDPSGSSGPAPAARGDRGRARTPAVERIEVKQGSPVGGVRRITLQKGDTARIVVSSGDTRDEVHVHGYDLTKKLAPGRRAAVFRFNTDLEGAFDIELEDAHAQLARLVVEPR